MHITWFKTKCNQMNLFSFFFKIDTSKLKHAFLVYLLVYEALIIRTFKVFGKTLLWFSSGSTQHIPSHFTVSTRHLVLKCIAV